MGIFDNENEQEKDNDNENGESGSFEVQYKIDGVGYHCTEEAFSQEEAEVVVLERISEAYPDSECNIVKGE